MLKLSISQPALNWLITEMDLTANDTIRFYVRYGGIGNTSGFSLGLTLNDKPSEPALSVTKKDILFFIEKKDAWYLDNGHLRVKYSRKRNEIEYVISNSID